MTDEDDKKFPMYGDYRLNHYFSVDIDEKITAKRFKVAVYRKGIYLERLEDAPDTPDKVLERVLAYLIDETRAEKKRESKQLPEKFSIIFRSAILEKPIQVSNCFTFVNYNNNNEIEIGYRPFEQNTLPVFFGFVLQQHTLTVFFQLILAEFEKVEQSYRARGLPSLFSQILHVEILLGPSSEEVPELINQYGRGRKSQKIVRNVKLSALIDVVDDRGEDDAPPCLFLALALTLEYQRILVNKM